VNSVAVIPARGGSVRLPRKNVRLFMGRPLIAWTIRAALDCGVMDRVIVSTDDPEIAEAAVAAGAEVPFLRPAHLATSEATSMDVVLHLLDALALAPDHVTLLQPTSPLRGADDIRDAHAMALDGGAPGVVSVTPFDKPWPVLRRLDGTGWLTAPSEPIEGPPTHMLNGAIYHVRRSALLESGSFTPAGTVGFVMSADRSVDIDTATDWALAEATARLHPDRFAAPV
jgi:CMP-N-acetylneuraminic acid synthetase